MTAAKIDFAKGNGLVPVIVQDYQTRDVLMVAYMNEEAWEKTKETGKAHYYSRSRKGPGSRARSRAIFRKSKTCLSTATTTRFCCRSIRSAAPPATKATAAAFSARRAGADWKVIAERVFDPKEVYKKSS